MSKRGEPSQDHPPSPNPHTRCCRPVEAGRWARDRGGHMLHLLRQWRLLGGSCGSSCCPFLF